MKKEKRHETTSRRHFTLRAGAALAAGPLAVAPALAAAQEKKREAPPTPLAEGYLALIRARFGDRLTTAQLAQISQEIDALLRTQERLRAFKLENSDEPDFVFSV